MPGEVRPSRGSKICVEADGRFEIMAPLELETRLAVLEGEIAHLKSKVEGRAQPGVPWWDRIIGSFAADPAHEKAMRLGREYRASLRTGKSGVRKKR
jgi:hypothetical protein